MSNAAKSLTLHIQPSLMPVFSFRVDGFALITPHILILNIVQMKHCSWLTDLVVWREVRGIHFPPNDMRNGTEKTQNQSIKFRLAVHLPSRTEAPNVHINSYVNACILLAPFAWFIQYSEQTLIHNYLLSQSKALQCNIWGQHGSSVWEHHLDVCWVLPLTWGQGRDIT